MNINTYNQLFNLAIFILTGIIISILFDIFRIIRKSFKTPDFITYIEDILFWILAGFILLFTIFTFNNGELRIYIFIGLLIGIILYMLTLSKYFIKICVAILLFIKKIIYYPISLVIRFLKRFIFKPFTFVVINIKRKFKKIIKHPLKKMKKGKFFNIFAKTDE